ncbi:MAG: hypothetical protein OXI86_06680, partial [Candidatus Poribacteria bacterium]|nr:hypothetical protein [Candidatus Poribacteria bacterium]
TRSYKKKRSKLRATTGEPYAKNGWRDLKDSIHGKLPGPWKTRLALLSPTAHRTRDSNGDGFGDFDGTRQHVHHLGEIGISGPLLKQKISFPCNPLG